MLSPVTIPIKSPDGDKIGVEDGRAFTLRNTFDVTIMDPRVEAKAAVGLAVPLLRDVVGPHTSEKK